VIRRWLLLIVDELIQTAVGTTKGVGGRRFAEASRPSWPRTCQTAVTPQPGDAASPSVAETRAAA
jgi:hypothetical protein